jgi:DNA-binding NarL/FixJ family response regulator
VLGCPAKGGTRNGRRRTKDVLGFSAVHAHRSIEGSPQPIGPRANSEVSPSAVRGLLNKQIASELGASEVTIKMHRAQVMHKMRAESVVELLRMAETIAPIDDGSSPTKVL